MSASQTRPLNGQDVITALGYPAYDGAANPAGFTDAAAVAGQIAADARVAGALQAGQDLADLADPATARASLGLAPVASTGAYADLSGLPAAYALPPASETTLGGIKVGAGLAIDGAGLLGVTAAAGGPAYSLPPATADTLGGVRIGPGLSGAAGLLGVSFGATAGAAAEGNDARITGAAQAAQNLADLADPATARTNLGLAAIAATGAYADLAGAPAAYVLPAATASALGGIKLGIGLGSASGAVSVSFGTASGTAAEGSDARITGAAQTSQNLADLANKAAARGNLGLAAIAATGAYADLAGAPAAYVLPAATPSTLGGIKPGAGLASAAGVVSVSFGTASGTAAEGSDARITGAAQTSQNLADLANKADARGNLGLAAVAASGAYADLSGQPAAYALPTATSSVLGGVKLGAGLASAAGVVSVSYGATAGAAAAGNDARITGAAQKASNLSDLASAATARSNLGLAAVAASGAYADLTGKPALPAPASTAPPVDGTAATGTSAAYARADHVHATDSAGIAAGIASDKAGDVTLDKAAVLRILGVTSADFAAAFPNAGAGSA